MINGQAAWMVSFTLHRLNADPAVVADGHALHRSHGGCANLSDSTPTMSACGTDGSSRWSGQPACVPGSARLSLLLCPITPVFAITCRGGLPVGSGEVCLPLSGGCCLPFCRRPVSLGPSALSSSQLFACQPLARLLVLGDICSVPGLHLIAPAALVLRVPAAITIGVRCSVRSTRGLAFGRLPVPLR